MTPLRSLAWPLALLALALSTAGCGPDLLEPAVDIDGKKLCIIPFSGPDGGPYFSSIGNQLARGVDRSLRAYRAKDSSDVIDAVPFEALVEAAGTEDPTDIEDHDMAKRVKADTFLVGAITKFERRRQGDVGMIRGRASIKLRMQETARPFGPPLLAREIKVSFPPDDFQNWGGLVTSEATEQDIENGLMAKLTDEIGKLFRYHLADPAARR